MYVPYNFENHHFLFFYHDQTLGLGHNIARIGYFHDHDVNDNVNDNDTVTTTPRRSPRRTSQNDNIQTHHFSCSLALGAHPIYLVLGY